jgi:2-hydroxychromene-2-carboxylate isomerase
VVEYFHQVEDGYSHLAAQVLQQFCQRYDIELVCHLVRGPQGKNSPEPDLLLQLSRYDAFHVAPEYGLQFPAHPNAPDPALIALATAVLAAQDSENFVASAAQVGDALWSGDRARLQGLADSLGCAGESQREARCSTTARSGTGVSIACTTWKSAWPGWALTARRGKNYWCRALRWRRGRLKMTAA